MSESKLYLGRRVVPHSSRGGEYVLCEALFSSHEMALAYAKAYPMHGDPQPGMHLVVVELIVDSREPYAPNAEWRYALDGALLCRTPDEAATEAAPVQARRPLAVGTVVRMKPWPWCPTAVLTMPHVGVIDTFFDDTPDEEGNNQYCVSFLNEEGFLEQIHVCGEASLVPLEKTDWQNDEVTGLLAEWASGELEIPEELLQQLQDQKVCGRCLGMHLDEY